MFCIVTGEHLWEIQEGRFGKAVPADITCIVASELGITADVAEYEKIVQRKNVRFYFSPIILTENVVHVGTCENVLSLSGHHAPC